MPPVQPPFKSDGPACRVCGCTQNNACVEVQFRPHPSNPSGPATTRTAVGCRWLRLPPVDSFQPLCSACAGGTDDAMEVIGRLNRMMIAKGFKIDDARAVAAAFLRRHKLRKEFGEERQKTG